MLYLSFIWHMHQPYYLNLLTKEAYLPWVRMHGIKDYLDMLTILGSYPKIHQVFNLVPSLLEQVESYANQDCQDRFLNLSYKKAEELSKEEKKFVLDNFFMINERNVIAIYPRYYDLLLKKKNKREFSVQDYLDLQVWFNLAWIDPVLLEKDPELKALSRKARFFSQEDKALVLNKQKEILGKIIPAYKKFQENGQIEISTTPFYHPILPLIFNTKIARAANPKTHLPKNIFRQEQDCRWHIRSAVEFYKERFGAAPQGMWPSEQAISKQIMPLLIEQGIQWIVLDEGILFRSLKKGRSAEALYQPYAYESRKGNINIIFRDRALSDLIGFNYYNMDEEKAVDDFMMHLKNINSYFKGKDCLVVIAMDGENAWEHYKHDGHDFLNLLYKRLSESEDIKTITVKEYLNLNQQRCRIKKISAGSWINSDFTKWIGHPSKNKAWQLLFEARKALEDKKGSLEKGSEALIYRQMYILEGSDWFWWYADKHREFDELFRIHLKNFYALINENPRSDLNKPLE